MALARQPGMFKSFLSFVPLRRHFPEPGIVDIHILTGLANMTNRFTDAFRLELEFPEEKI